MITATLISAPLGTVCAHAEGWALPRAMFTRIMMSFTATLSVPLQSPMQPGRAVVTVADAVGVPRRADLL
jgi:hypothetical protein